MSSVSSPIILLGLVGLGVLYGIALAIYRLYFHPLASFPGPKIAAATKWWEFYLDNLKGQGGTYAFKIDRMHEIYGPIVRVNPDELHVKDPEWYETLYTGNPSKRDKYPPAAHMVGTPLGTFGTVSHDLHRKRRAAISPFFSKRSVDATIPTFYKNVDLLMNALRYNMKNDNPVDIRAGYLAYSTESVCNAAFKSSLDLLKNPNLQKAGDWKKTMEAVGNITPLVKQFTWIIPIALRLPTSVVRFFHEDLARLFFIHKDMYRRATLAVAEDQSTTLPIKEKSDTSPTIFQTILSSTLPGEEKRAERMGQEAFIIVVAGSDTISRILTAGTFHLLNNPPVLEKLKKELWEAMPDPYQNADIKVLEELPWLTAVIKESLRIAALLTSRLPLMAHEELTYGSWKIPPKTPVSMTLGSILMDPYAFTEPYLFKPERWLAESPEAPQAHRFLVPFNRGTRMCIGNTFAWSELYLVLATVFRRFELKLFDTFRERDVDHSRDCFLGKPMVGSQGVRIKIVREITA